MVTACAREVLERGRTLHLAPPTSLERLSQLETLERLEFWEIAGITDGGVKMVAALPHLREISIGGSPRITRDGVAHFAPHVRVRLQP